MKTLETILGGIVFPIMMVCLGAAIYAAATGNLWLLRATISAYSMTLAAWAICGLVIISRK